MSFCRITGRSRGLPKPNYFPLLPPISPADAKRFCRITGKSYGLPTHHYIPVLLGIHSHDKSKCKITNASGLGPHHYTAGFVLGEKKKHVVLKDYRYVFPVLEGEGEQQRALRDLLSKKHPLVEEEQAKFVYTVEERRCSLVFPSRLEAAVRDGDVKDVMLSRDCDTVLFRLKQGKNVSVDFKNLEDFENLYDGLGPSQEVLKERERLEAEAKRRKRKRQAGLSYAKRIFEEKERAAEEEELRQTKQLKLRSVKEETQEEMKEETWKNVNLKQARSRACNFISVTKPLKGGEKSLPETLDWNSFQDTNEPSMQPIVDKLPTPVKVEPQIVEQSATTSCTSPISESTGGFEAISIVKPLTPLKIEPDAALQSAIRDVPASGLKEVSNVNMKLLQAGEEAIEQLPRVEEIPELVQKLSKGKVTTQHNVKGLKLDIKSAQRFITGQTVQTPNGPIFVPGQTLQTPQGPAFVPGLTVNTPDGPLLVAGQILNLKEQDNKETPVFIAGQTLATEQGHRFIQGQTFHTNEGARFVQGQTVLTDDGPKFVAGQVTKDGTFIPGQTIHTPDGPRFMPGQTITDNHGEQIFVPGQSVRMNETWEFIPGQTIETPTGEMKFVSGQTIPTCQGLQFVPGQYVVSNSGENYFMPGIVKDTENGSTFVPGMTLDTPKGQKFVEGQVVRTPMGEKFLPGSTRITDKGIEFAAASTFDEVVFYDAGPVGMPVDPKTVNVSIQQSEIFGHMVQTEKGVEFFPEDEKKLPEGKRIVPGQLVRGGKDGPRFVPGVMTEDGFLPGQIVMTEKGEQFVPGQVIDTSTGPKFVPGQMVETRTGTKFVPGQTVDTADGPRFVPGQIVETKAGPTFIPGQVISTDDEGSRFVPGQVVDTPDGPRFVPGRVVESGELGVTFVPGQIVQTEEGPRFVAPDLTDTPEGELEFSVQGFEVTPEELKLLRPQNLHYNRHVQHQGETSIDARMLRQLSEAGLSVGRKVTTDLPAVDVDVDPKAVALEHALVMAEKLGLHGTTAVKMAQIVSTVAQLAKNIVIQQEQQLDEYCIESKFMNGAKSPVVNGNRNGEEQENENENDYWLKDAVKIAMTSAVLAIMSHSMNENGNDSKQDFIYSSISEAFNVLLRQRDSSVDQSVEEILQILLVPQNRSNLCQSALLNLLESKNNKVDILKSTVGSQSLKEDVVLDRLSMVLEEEHGTDLIGPAFRTVSKNDPELVSRVLRKVSEEVSTIVTEKEAAETVHKAIVHAVRESSEIHVQELLNDEGGNVREMFLQAVGLARALGMSNIASSLLAVISDEKSTQALAGDRVTLDVLKRLTVMRKLAEERPPFMNALTQLCSDPELARTDPRLRTLVRESAALMIVPEEGPLQSSTDVPSILLQSDNSLAMEEFLLRRNHRPSTIFMILKQGMQAVVPREASRSVLTGEVAYTVLDEDGIHHFEPLHVFSALQLTRPTAHRFSMYCCPVAKEEDVDVEMMSTFTGTTSMASSLDGSGTGTYQRQEFNGIVLSKSDKSFGQSGSRENTPSLRRLSNFQDNYFERKSLDNYIVVKDYKNDGFSVNVGDIVEALEYADPAKVYVRTADSREGWLPMSILMQTALSEDSALGHRPEDSQYRREAVVKELVETEEEFGRDLQQVVERYLKPLDNPDVPRIVRDNKDIIFTNLKQIADFHNTSFGRVLIEGVKYYADQPRMLGKTFLRLERDFDKHVAYCRDEPAAQEFLQMNDAVREYFEELSQTLRDDKSLSEHLKLPIQRINDYQLLLKEWYTVIDKDGKSKERYLFLFKARILICKVRRISEDRSVFVLKDIIRLPDVEVKDHPDDIRSFELHNPASPAYPITLVAHKDPVKAYWLKEIRQYASDVVALAEHAADDLQLTEVLETKEEIKGNPGTPPQKATGNPGPKAEGNPGPKKAEGNPGPKKAEGNPGPNPGESAEKKKDNPGNPDSKQVEEGGADMSRRYSSSRYSSSSKVVEVSSSAAYMESSVSQSSAVRMESSSYQAGNSIETRSNTAKIEGGSGIGKPVFVKTLEGSSVEPGEMTVFECTLLHTDATTRVQWLKDNKPLEDRLADRLTASATGKTFRLQLQNVLESDSGIYIARAMNSGGQATCTAQLVVQKLTPEEKKARAEANAPIFLVRLKDTELLENTYLRFMVKVKGDPNPEMKFFKDDVLIDENHPRVKVVTEQADKGFYELVIADVQKQDAGKYSCTAKNRFGEASCEATVTVSDEKMLYLPEDFLEPGMEPKLTWLRDGKPFDPEERFKVLFQDDEDTLALVFQHVKPEDAGLYTCVAQTSTGNISCSAELTVQGAVHQLLKEPEKPKLCSESRHSEVSAGGSAMLELQIRGYPKPDIKWSKDGEEIVAGGRYKYLWEDEESMSLVIKNVTAKDAGTYKIRAKNELGEDTTQIELIVKSAPKVTKKQTDTTVNISETSTMVVQIEATPAPEVKWYKDGQELREDSRISIVKEDSETYKLILRNARLDDSGSYSIVARNEVNQTTEIWNLKVLSPPKITKRLGESQVLDQGNDLTLFVEVDSLMPPSIKWYKDGELIVEDSRLKMTREGKKFILKITGIVSEDTGIYKAEVSSDHGVVTDETKIEVRGLPRFKTKLHDITVNEGEKNVEFKVEIDGCPKPSIRWYIGDVEITEKRKDYVCTQEDNFAKLFISDVKGEMKGTYTCKLKNEFGEVENSSNLIVNTRPKLLKKLADQRINEGDTLKLIFEVGGTPDPEVKWFKDGEEVSTDARIKITRDSKRQESYNLTVTLVKGSDAGIYEVRAENELGFVTSKSKVLIMIRKCVNSIAKTEESVEERTEMKKETVEKISVEEEETKAQKAEEKEIETKKERAEESGPEGRVKLEKQSVQVTRGQGDTITISVASTTTHEAILTAQAFTGPDESHTISKMTVTKVECQEINTDSPAVEEIATYSYSLQEESVQKPQNGVLIEEFSENSEDNKSRLQTNRGVSIVSVSDDESTLKAISRDVSTDDMQHAELSEDNYARLINGSYEEFNGNGHLAEEKILDDVKPYRGSIITETIAEERSVEESPSEKSKQESMKLPQSAVLENGDSFERKVSTADLEQPQTPTIEEGKLTKEKIERANSIAEKIVVTNVEERRGSVENGLSRQSSKIERIDSMESRKTFERSISRESALKAAQSGDEEVDEELEALLDRVKRQRSVLDDILEKESSRDSAPPHIIETNLIDQTIYETQNIVFDITATSLPRADGKWFKDGKPLRTGDRIKIATVGEHFSLELQKVIIEDEGVYTCIFTNKLGEDMAEGYLTVQTVDELRRPKFIEPLNDVDVAKGKNGKFKAAFTADPIPEIIWYFKGEEIPADDSRLKSTVNHKPANDKLTETTVTLSVPKCSKEDTGEYTLKLTNKYGKAEAGAILNLLRIPEIQEFKDVVASVGESITWEAIVKGNPKPDVTWTKNGTVLKLGDRFDFSEDKRNKKFRLIIKDVEVEDKGTYHLIAKNYLGEASGQATLTPHTETPNFLKSLAKHLACKHRDDVELKIRVSGVPKPTVIWLKDDEEIKEDDRHRITTHVDGIVDSIHSIATFSQSDIGRIKCRANNVAGSAQTTCNLTMQLIAPSFSNVLPKSTEVDEGDPLELKVKIDGSPIPEIAWYKDGEKIVPNEHIKIETLPDGNTKLTIDCVKPTDCGAYKLVVSNPSGEQSSLCAVAVKPARRKPSFSKSLEDTKAVVGQPLKLEAQVVAFPNPQVQWFKDGIPLRHSKEIYFMNEPNGVIGLRIDHVRPEDAGVYSMTVSNSLGEITGSAKIIPDGNRIKTVTLPDGTQALVIDKVTPEDAGEYQVIAGNTEGTSSCKGRISVLGKQLPDQPEEKPGFVSPMRDVYVEEGQPLNLSAYFTGNPIPEISWSKDGAPLQPSDRLSVSCDGKKTELEINPCEPQDAGVYECRVSNPLGEDSTKSTANVKKTSQPPSFMQTFKDLQQLPSFDAKFLARVTGVPRPDVTWYFNDRLISHDDDKYKIKRDGDACCLYVKDCTYDDAGTYKCKAVNRGGEAECAANLAVIDKIGKIEKAEPPSFLKRIGDCEIYKGMPAKFTACITGIPEPDFEWFQNGQKLWQTDRIRTEQEGSLLRLIIHNADELDAGKYTLKIRNPHGEDSCTADLIYDSLEPRAKRALGDQYTDFDKYRKSGVPLPLADRPIISRMMDRHLTLSWKPSIPIGPRIPVTYQVEMCELPDGDWFTARTGIRSCVCDIRNLEPFRDYKFRIRVENKYGISDPSPFAQTYRAKLEPEPPKFFPYLPPGIDFRPETSPYFPKDFDIERPPHDNYAQAPRFLRQEHDTQYGVKNHNCNLFWFVYGYPKPKMTYYFNDQLIESGGRMLERDEGMYEAVATNEHGEARQRVRLRIAEYPTFIQRPEETIVMIRKVGQLMAKISGVPYPEIKWYKDWKPLTTSSRIRARGDDLKICDFGLTRKIVSSKLMTLTYGMPEYVAPEVTNNEGVSFGADMWSVGIITYILLSGISPFRGNNDMETILKVRKGHWEFDDRWKNISEEAKDFIRSLLLYNVDRRMDVAAALKHPWLNYADRSPLDLYKIPSENLKNYYKLYRDWYNNASCRTWFRRRKLNTAFEHPSKMIYPPAHKYTPEPEERPYTPIKRPPVKPWEDQISYGEPLDTEIGIIKSESHYQNGPDTYLLQLRDTDFPVRLREYMKVACNRSPGFSRNIAEDNFDWRAPIIRERRRFTDIMDEEIDDERRARISRYGSPDTFTLRRLKHELGTRLDSYAEAEAMIESKKEGHLPFFREKPQIKPIEEGKPAYLACLAVGKPKPVIQWYKNDLMIQESNRVKITEDEDGRSILSFNPTKEHDVGSYKVVARNSLGQTAIRARLVEAEVPSGPDSPEAADVSDTEILVRWKQPKRDGNSPVLCYNLQYKEGDSVDWIDIASNIDHEFYLIRNLKPDTSYNFRLAARNRIGWSEKGIQSNLIKTKLPGCPKVQITRAMRHLQELTESGQEITLDEDKPHMDYSIEEHPIEWSTDTNLSNKYSFISEIYRGQFSVVLKGVDKSSDRVIVAKILELNSQTEKQVNREFEALRSLRHERIGLLEAAYKAQGSPIAVFILEKLQGADILTYFSSKHEYTENCVAIAMTQILDGLQYLHWRGYCHLDIQPDNIVMSNVRSVQVKLVDMGSARLVSKLGTLVPKAGHPEYRAPEVYNEEAAHPQTDIWMVGVLMYVLLSGVSPFRGNDPDETRQNILFVRYRFEHLYKELSQEATRFLMLVFKRAPRFVFPVSFLLYKWKFFYI
ncbi:hypothetical protein E2986_07915 [Frieseomelitta varia]|uniref:Muscle M-line assembly protein unc-89 n=1 Tax=Frieseomelitta varia TaxID=561572 RepID=A0A833SDT9_9HYME|nr:hypothetical protein E2986_07915 [Frieseomelitta varia]